MHCSVIYSWPSLSKQIKTGGFQKCKVHCSKFKGFKVTSFQSLAWLGFEPRPPAWVNFPMLCDSRGRPGLKSQQVGTLKTCNFEALKVTAVCFKFSETSSLYLFGQGSSRAYLIIQSMICYLEWPQEKCLSVKVDSVLIMDNQNVPTVLTFNGYLEQSFHVILPKALRHYQLEKYLFLFLFIELESWP